MISDSERDIIILRRLLKYCRDVKMLMEQFGENYKQFSDNTAYQYSVSMAVFQAGELSNHLSDEFKQNHPDIPWNVIRGMRNLFAHQYYEMNIKVIWKTALEDIPSLAEFCEKVLADHNKK
ncbi:MAG: DUF86 domain-containing protein [Oscillospiraceae bacterium]|nr:DUF86 domain-containing protein [Oscillospiraceae bacterium]